MFENSSSLIFTLWIWIQIRIQMELDLDLDPDPHYNVYSIWIPTNVLNKCYKCNLFS